MNGTPSTWRDPKRHLWILGALMPLMVFLAWGLVQLTGTGVMWYSPLVIFFVLLPIADMIVGGDAANPPDEAMAELDADKYYRWLTYAFLPIQYVSLVWGMWMIANGGLTTSDRIGLGLTLGLVAGVAINTAHELGHKSEDHERWFARIALAQPAYGHFFVEHNRGHHVRVATPEDPASSRFGESLWRFLPRSIVGSARSAWHLERLRMKTMNKPFLHPSNELLNGAALTVVLFGGLTLWLGPVVLPYLFLQAAVGIWLLETVNYLEHYGLKRGKDKRGRYEKVRPAHSWNSNHAVSNLVLYHLQRHSDHHANPTRRYQTLRDFDEAPVLPTGYMGMIVLATIPPLWRRVMDPRVTRHYEGNMSLLNTGLVNTGQAA
jgi:alkane 1-monooxygenase